MLTIASPAGLASHVVKGLAAGLALEDALAVVEQLRAVSSAAVLQLIQGYLVHIDR